MNFSKKHNKRLAHTYVCAVSNASINHRVYRYSVLFFEYRCKFGRIFSQSKITDRGE